MSSSDLELARALSRLLAEAPGTGPAAAPATEAAPVEPADPSRYVRLRREVPPGLSVPAGASGTRS